MEILNSRRRISGLRPRLALILLMLGLVLLPARTATADESLEYGVKAAFLYKFGFYVEWPATAFATPASPINLCIAGSEDPFGSALEKAGSGESVNGRSIIVRRIKIVERVSGCHILYIGVAQAHQSAQILDAVRGSNVLTVSDAGGSGSAGIIDFVIVNNRVRFNIDDEAAAQNGLVISSKLMSLALNIKRRTTQGVRK
jgi:uncharacterized protein DUF4154